MICQAATWGNGSWKRARTARKQVASAITVLSVPGWPSSAVHLFRWVGLVSVSRASMREAPNRWRPGALHWIVHFLRCKERPMSRHLGGAHQAVQLVEHPGVILVGSKPSQPCSCLRAPADKLRHELTSRPKIVDDTRNTIANSHRLSVIDGSRLVIS